MTLGSPPSALLPRASYASSFVAEVFALTWTLGGGVVALQLALFDHAGAAEGPLWGIATASLATGVASFLLGPRIPPGLFAPGMFLGVAATSVGIVLAGNGRLSAAFLLFYVWVATFAFLFFRLSTAIVVGAFSVAGYVTATASIGRVSLASPLTLLATIAVVGVIIDGLHRTRSSSEVDVVTGAANAAGLERRLGTALADAGDGDDLAVAILDLDGFSRVNAALGHAAGDRFLAQLADAWGAELTDGDLLARLRGDRFVVLFVDRTKDEAVGAAERLRAATPPSVTCSVGIALPRAGDSTAMVLRRADAALYAAKTAGRDRVVVDGDDRTAVRELATAIDAHELVLMTQPIVDARTGRIRGFEALVRWQHPQRGMLGPAEFIPLAEHTGLIVPLGMVVLDQACSHARRWLDDFPDEALTIAVNVSGHQLEDAGFVSAVTSALDRHGLPPDRLVIEVTETVLANDLGTWREHVAELRDLGVGISMDDFGTGYSSLGQLRELPFGTIKIDRAFVSDLPDSTEADALIAAVVGMAAGLGKKTVAEGVETVEQLIRLRQHGCDELQGYLFGRPAPIADAHAMICQQDTSQRLIRAVAAADPGSPGRRSADRTLASGIEDATALEDVVRPLLRHLLAVGDVDSAYLTSIDWDALAQLILFSENVGDRWIAEGVGIAWADTICRRALEDGVSHTPDAQKRFPDSRAARDLDIRSYATEPIVLPDGTAFGTLCVASRSEGDVPEHLRSLLAVYSRLIAERIAAARPPRPVPTDARAG